MNIYRMLLGASMLLAASHGCGSQTTELVLLHQGLEKIRATTPLPKAKKRAPIPRNLTRYNSLNYNHDIADFYTQTLAADKTLFPYGMSTKDISTPIMRRKKLILANLLTLIAEVDEKNPSAIVLNWEKLNKNKSLYSSIKSIQDTLPKLIKFKDTDKSTAKGVPKNLLNAYGTFYAKLTDTKAHQELITELVSDTIETILPGLIFGEENLPKIAAEMALVDRYLEPLEYLQALLTLLPRSLQEQFKKTFNTTFPLPDTAALLKQLQDASQEGHISEAARKAFIEDLVTGDTYNILMKSFQIALDLIKPSPAQRSKPRSSKKIKKKPSPQSAEEIEAIANLSIEELLNVEAEESEGEDPQGMALQDPD